ncbi:MAG: helix-turn-helix transcriptional regulator [Bacteroidales bacterium]|nr:helix-turn-helix transcriptional regulator [Bacteroidales bacterium]
MTQEVENKKYIDQFGPSIGAEVVCHKVDCQSALSFVARDGKMAFYAYTIVTSGSATIRYNGRQLVLHRNDIYTYTPGYTIDVVDASDDYHALTLFASESLTFDTSLMRSMIRTAYFPFVALHDPRLPLTDTQAALLLRQVENIMDHQYLPAPLRGEALRHLYAAFLLDLLAVQEHIAPHRHSSDRTEEIFIDFIHLLPQHFAEHHDIPFYADRLCITPIYLSRVVRQVSGRTVVDYINQMLLGEASWLLRSTDLTTVQIADRLHFSSQASFCRFFTRLRGVSPKVFRERG